MGPRMFCLVFIVTSLLVFSQRDFRKKPTNHPKPARESSTSITYPESDPATCPGSQAAALPEFASRNPTLHRDTPAYVTNPSMAQSRMSRLIAYSSPCIASEAQSTTRMHASNRAQTRVRPSLNCRVMQPLQLAAPWQRGFRVQPAHDHKAPSASPQHTVACPASCDYCLRSEVRRIQQDCKLGAVA